MYDSRQRSGRGFGKILFDAGHGVFARQYATARHGAQGFARLQLLRSLL